MSIEIFKRAVLFANRNNLKITVLHDEQGLPDSYLAALDGTEFSIISPVSSSFKYSSQIFIVDYEGSDDILQAIAPFRPNIILRFESTYFSDLIKIIHKYSNRFQRINLFIKDIDRLSEQKINEYGNLLKAISEITYENIVIGKNPELNFLTDRMFINEMNNCDAGVKHITIGPNGKFYLCPGFYYENEKQSVGSVDTGLNNHYKNLLKLENAPICNICDAFHCKRCIYLNKKTTLELNTPSHEQCVISHLERNETKRMVDNLRKHSTFKHIFHISKISYIDPFEIIKANPAIKRGWQMNEYPQTTDTDSTSEVELLKKVYNLQLEINKLIKEQLMN